MTQAEKVQDLLQPNKEDIRDHIKFITSGMDKYDDGRFEIAYGDLNNDNAPNKAQSFGFDEVEAAVTFAVEKNLQKRNVYIVGSVLIPNDSAPTDKRSSDKDFYASSVLWCDIDNKDDKNPITPQKLQELYKHLPPTRVIVTGRVPNIRVHLWWKLDRSEDDDAALETALKGVCSVLGGDSAVTNETSLMRLAGTVSYATAKKKAAAEKTGKQRIDELVSFGTIVKKSERVNIDQFIRSYPYSQTIAHKPRTAKSLFLSQHKDYSIDEVRGMLACIPPDTAVFDESPKDTYLPWIKVGMGLFRGGYPFELWEEWSSKGEKFKLNQNNEMIKKWNGFGSGAAGFGTVHGLAKKYGYGKRAQEQASTENASHETNTENQKRLLKIDEWVASKRYTGTAKPIRWLVEGVFPAGVPCLLAAMGGLGKSFIALDMAIKIAMPSCTVGDHKVLGRSVMSHGTAVLITAEDSFDSIHRRINRLAPPEVLAKTLENLIIIPMSEVDVSQLLVREGRNGLEMTEFFTDIKNQLIAVKNLQFIGIDPLQAFVGADITAKPEAAQFMWSAFAKIASQTGATFFATHHMRKDGMGEVRTAADAREGIRGTTGLVDGARAVYVMWQTVKDIGEALARAIDVPYEPHRFVQGSIVKANDEADHNVMSFYRKDEGVLFCLGNVDISGAPESTDKLTDNQDKVYRAIVNAIATHGKSVHIRGKGVTAIDFDRLRKQLEEEGYREWLWTKNDDESSVAKKAKNNTESARVSLKKKGLILFEKNWIWLPVEEAGKSQYGANGQEEKKPDRSTSKGFENEFE